MRSFRFGVVGVAVLVGCASYSMDFLSSYEPGQDYSRYRTFNFYEESGRGDLADKAFDERLRAAVEAGMLANGYTRAEHPDFYVTYWVDVQDRQSLETIKTYHGDDKSVVGNEPYKSGSLVLDFVDAEDNQRYWRGMAVGEIAERTPKDRLEKAVALILDNYPPGD